MNFRSRFKIIIANGSLNPALRVILSEHSVRKALRIRNAYSRVLLRAHRLTNRKNRQNGGCFSWWRRGKSQHTRVQRLISQYFTRKIGDFARFSLIFYHFPDCHFRLIFVPTSAILVYKLISSEANVSFCLR